MLYRFINYIKLYNDESEYYENDLDHDDYHNENDNQSGSFSDIFSDAIMIILTFLFCVMLSLFTYRMFC